MKRARQGRAGQSRAGQRRAGQGGARQGREGRADTLVTIALLLGRNHAISRTTP